MDDRQWTHLVRLVTIAIFAAAIGMVVIGVIYVDPQFPLVWRKFGIISFYSGLATIGIVGGATLIYQVVRWFNRQDDPREAKHPPDRS